MFVKHAFFTLSRSITLKNYCQSVNNLAI